MMHLALAVALAAIGPVLLAIGICVLVFTFIDAAFGESTDVARPHHPRR